MERERESSFPLDQQFHRLPCSAARQAAAACPRDSLWPLVARPTLALGGARHTHDDRLSSGTVQRDVGRLHCLGNAALTVFHHLTVPGQVWFRVRGAQPLARIRWLNSALAAFVLQLKIVRSRLANMCSGWCHPLSVFHQQQCDNAEERCGACCTNSCISPQSHGHFVIMFVCKRDDFTEQIRRDSSFRWGCEFTARSVLEHVSYEGADKVTNSAAGLQQDVCSGNTLWRSRLH
eukprot:scpid77955/ scgid11594/ 